jgi:uncharacterized protein (DUF983 family)
MEENSKVEEKSIRGNCPQCGGVLEHLWADYLGLTDDWSMNCTKCGEKYDTLFREEEVKEILRTQPHIVISRW